MKRFLLLTAVATGSLVLCPRDTSSYVLYGPKWGGGTMPSTSGGDIDWLFDAAGTPDMAGGPATQDGEYSILISCLLEWEDATGGNLDLQYIGTTTAIPVSGDTTHIVKWEETTWTWGASAVGITVYTYTGSTMLDADVYLNGVDYTWSSATVTRQVSLHELGHAMGLGHSADSTAIMYPVVGASTTLQPDDLAGIRALYGLGGGGDGVTTAPPPPPSSDNNSSTSSDDDDHKRGGVRGVYDRYKKKYCVVATAAFGSPDASRIEALRAMRDRSLRATESGDRFVSLYENAAAPGAQVVKRSEVLRALVRRALP